MKNSFEEWVQEIAEGASNREIAMKAGIPMTTFHRKWTKGEFTAEDAVTIARAYGRNPIEALVEQGTLTPDEVHNAGVHPIEEFTMLELSREMLELSREMLRRVQQQASMPDYLSEPMDGTSKKKSN